MRIPEGVAVVVDRLLPRTVGTTPQYWHIVGHQRWLEPNPDSSQALTAMSAQEDSEAIPRTQKSWLSST